MEMEPRQPGDEVMKTFSAFNDDGITVMVMASNEEEATEKTADRIAEIGFEFDTDFFEDNIEDAYLTDDETVSDWLVSNGVKLNETNMLIMECDDIEQSVQVYEL